MKYVETFFIINFGVCAALLTLGMFSSNLLFKSLKKNYISYYKSIGEPMIIIPLNFTEDDYIRALKGGVYAYGLVFRGIPKNFPKDVGLRKLAQTIRIFLTALLVLLISLVIEGYFFYKSTS